MAIHPAALICLSLYYLLLELTFVELNCFSKRLERCLTSLNFPLIYIDRRIHCLVYFQCLTYSIKSNLQNKVKGIFSFTISSMICTEAF